MFHEQRSQCDFRIEPQCAAPEENTNSRAGSITEVGIVGKNVLGHGKDAGLAVKLNFVR